MTKLLTASLLAMVLPAAASASSINLSAAVVKVNKDMSIASGNTFGAGLAGGSASPMAPPCVVGVCGDPVGCTSSPENPTALLAVLGASGMLLGRFGYGRMRDRRVTVAVAA